MVIFFSSFFRQAYVPTLKYFLLVTVPWNFRRSVLTSIPRHVFGLFSKKLALFRVRDLELFCDQYSFIVPIFNFIRVATAQWNFIHSFLSLILCDVFGFISEFQIFFKNLVLFRIKDLEHFSNQYSSIVPTFSYLWVATAQWIFLHCFFSLIPRNIFVSLSKFKIFFEKLALFYVSGTIILIKGS